MISLYYPIYNEHCTKNCTQQYMPSKTAAASNKQFFGCDKAEGSVFDKVQYVTCCEIDHDIDHVSVGPLVFLEPAVGTSRLLYGGIAQEIASYGHPVITIDHPYDANIVEYSSPDSNSNSTILGTVGLSPFEKTYVWNKTFNKAVNTREQDIKFLISQLGNKAFVQQLLPNFKVVKPFKTDRFGIVGHGLGGSVATWMSATDPRFKISINMGGPPPNLRNDVWSSVVFFGRAPGARREDDIHWPSTWPRLRGKTTEWDMQNAGIFDFSDLPILVDLKENESGKEIKDVKGLGSIIRWKAFGITAQWCSAYMRMEFGEAWQGNALSSLVRYFSGEMLPWQPAKPIKS